jgi:hypothetical protein
MKQLNQKQRILFTTIITCSIIIIGACNPKPETVTPTSDQVQLKNLFLEFAAKKVITSVDNSVGASIHGNGGSRLIIQPNSFKSKTGALISGMVEVEFSDFTNRADMIFSKALPISNGEPLVSGGEFLVKATVGGQAVFLDPNKPIMVNLPQFGKNNPGLQPFKGKPIVGEANTVNWMLADSNIQGSSMMIYYNGDSVSVLDDSCEWANADRFLTNPNYVDFDININGLNIEAGSFVGYCLYQDFNGCWPLNFKNATQFSASHIPDIACHFVLFGFHNNEFYSGVITNVTPSMGTSQTISLMKSDPVALKNLLKSI